MAQVEEIQSTLMVSQWEGAYDDEDPDGEEEEDDEEEDEDGDGSSAGDDE